MFIQKATLAFVLCIACFTVKGQDYFIVNDDTTYCKKLKFSTTAQGYLKTISYVVDGKTTSIEGRKVVPDVTTFYIDGQSIDKVPLKHDKPNGYVRYVVRQVDGKLRLYVKSQSTLTYSDGSQSAAGTYKIYLKMQDGTYLDVLDRKTMKKVIIPYLEKCADFKAEYTGNYSTYEPKIIETIKLYNSLCDN